MWKGKTADILTNREIAKCLKSAGTFSSGGGSEKYWEQKDFLMLKESRHVLWGRGVKGECLTSHTKK